MYQNREQTPQGGGRLNSPKNAVFNGNLTKTHTAFNLQLFAEKEGTKEAKTKRLSLIITLLLALVLAVVSVPVVAIISKNNANAFKTGGTSNFVEVGEIWDSTNKKFNKANLKTLYTYLSTGYNSTGNVTATDIRGYTNGKSSGKAVVVTLGGLKWQVVYITNNASGQRTATLWLSNCVQDAFSSRSSTEGAYYGYLNGGLYSDWAANWYSSSFTSTFPASMYGASYIRSVTLNNGGDYATSNSDKTNFSSTTSSAFAKFTMSSYGLTSYLVQPKNMSYQTSSQKGYCSGMSGYVYMNDSLANNLDGYYDSANSTNYNFQGNSCYKNWQNDYLWLPSMQEMGYSGTDGLWKTNANERMNYDGSNTSSLGNVGSTSGPAYAHSWSRSSSFNLSYNAYSVSSSGSSSSSHRVNYSYAVRPALHLNLQSAWLSTAFQVSVSASDSSQGTVSLGGGTYAENLFETGTAATITATPKSGYSLDYWLVNGTKITANPYSFTVNEDTTCVAYFRYYGASITSPNTTLNITSFRDANNFTNYFVTPVTTNLYIYSVQVGTNDAQILKSRSGNINYSGASSFIRYTVNEDNKEISFEIMNLKGDIDIKLTYVSENQDLPNTSGGASINGVVVNSGDGGQTLLNGYDSEDENAVIHISAISYTGYSFAGWYVDDEILTFTNSSGQTVTADSSKLSIDIPLSAVKGKIITAKFTKNTNSNINSETNNSHDFL